AALDGGGEAGGDALVGSQTSVAPHGRPFGDRDGGGAGLLFGGGVGGRARCPTGNESTRGGKAAGCGAGGGLPIAVLEEAGRGCRVVACVLEQRVGAELGVRGERLEHGRRREHVEAVPFRVTPGGGGD